MSRPNPAAAIVPRLAPASGLLLAALLLGAVFTLSMPDDKLWQRVMEDAGHGPVFAGLALVLLWLRAPPAGLPLRPFGQYRAAFLLLVVAGIVTELLQLALPSRSVSAADVVHDAAGAALGLALAWLIERRLARRRGMDVGAAHTAVAVAIALGAFVLLAWQPLRSARAYAARAAAWPSLLPLRAEAAAAFTRVHGASMSRAQLPAAYGRPGEDDSLRISFDSGARPGLQLLEPPADWNGFGQIVIDVTNPAPRPVSLGLRILDATHDWTYADRFNQVLPLPARTRSVVRISLEAVAASPRARRMDMAAIANVMFFSRRPLEQGELYVTRVWLE